MKKITTGLLIALATAFGSVAQADVAPDWNCHLEFEAKGKGLQVIIGMFKMKGKGLVTCENEAGQIQEIPVNVKMGGKLFQAQVAAGWLTVRGVSKEIGVEKDPSEIFGKYYVANAQAAVIGGVGATAGLDARRDDNVTLALGVQVTKGFGLAVGLQTLQITDAR